MSTHNLVHIPTYEGEEYPRRHWFVCERIWDATDVTDDEKKIALFAGALRKKRINLVYELHRKPGKNKR